MDAQTEDFIENMGLSLEADGLPRIAGRIFGLLLVSEGARRWTTSLELAWSE